MMDKKPKEEESFSKIVGDKEERKLLAQKDTRSVWAGLGLFGLVGWSITVPTLLGAALGFWLDKTYKQSFSWTLSMLVVGLMLGCLIAWNWIKKENKEIHKKNDDEDK